MEESIGGSMASDPSNPDILAHYGVKCDTRSYNRRAAKVPGGISDA